jgi:alkanesulfonate monooxygenase SsuD/methylene tetrahydromethanopterin reductase-like flavin-dependent oxidoreductase (luciferase family)
MPDAKFYLGYALSPFGFSASSGRGNRAADLGFDALLRQVDQAQVAGFDFISLFDRFGQRPSATIEPGNTVFEPTTLVAALSSRARGIGFLAAASTVQHEAYNLARRFASLDTISGGRTGWIALDDSESDERDLEYLQVVRGLWDSWDDDAFIYDKGAGRFFDPSKMHVLNHKGAHLSVRGPLNVNRSPQGRPVVAAIHGRGNPAIAARYADVVILQSTSIEDAGAAVLEISRLLDAAGRMRSDIRVIANILPFASPTSGTHADDENVSAGARGLAIKGSGDAVAETMRNWARQTGVDGFNVVPMTPDASNFFFADIAPKLAIDGLLQPEEQRKTLRDALGLKRPGRGEAEGGH